MEPNEPSQNGQSGEMKVTPTDNIVAGSDCDRHSVAANGKTKRLKQWQSIFGQLLIELLRRDVWGAQIEISRRKQTLREDTRKHTSCIRLTRNERFPRCKYHSPEQ